MSFTKIKQLYIAVNHVVAEIGKDGQIDTRHALVSALNDALADIDNGEFKPDLFDKAEVKLEVMASRITELEARNLELHHAIDDKHGIALSADNAHVFIDGMGLLPIGTAQEIESMKKQFADAKQVANDCRIVADNAIAEAQAALKDAERYQWLRTRDLDTVHVGGVFAGEVPQNNVLNGVDLDQAIDAAMQPKESK